MDEADRTCSLTRKLLAGAPVALLALAGGGSDTRSSANLPAMPPPPHPTTGPQRT